MLNYQRVKVWHQIPCGTCWQQVSLARKIRELEAQVAWDQKQMEHEMEEIKIPAVSLKRINSSINRYIYIYKQLHCCRKSWVWRTSWSTLRWVTLLTLLTIPAIPTDETRPVNLRLDAQGELRARKIASNMAVKDQWLCQTCDPVTWQRHQGSWQIESDCWVEVLWFYMAFCMLLSDAILCFSAQKSQDPHAKTTHAQRTEAGFRSSCYCEWWEKDESSNACLVCLC